MRTIAAIATVVCGFSLAAACGQPAPPATTVEPMQRDARLDTAQTVAPGAPVSAIPKVVFLGDSLTAGHDLPPQDALPDQVQNVLSGRGLSIEAINAGVSGDTTANGLARYDWSVAAADPDLLVVALGANDYLLGLPPELVRENLASIIERAQAGGIPVVLAGIAPPGAAQDASRDGAFAAIYPDLASTYGVPLMPGLMAGVRDDPDLLLNDGLHPNADGVAVMAESLSETLAAEIKALQP